VNDHHRKHYRAPQVQLDEAMVSQELGPEEVAEAALTRADLRRAMSDLTDEQQNVLALRFGHEMPIQEVARTLGKTEGAIKQLQARAIAALARKLSPGMLE
jgi:RNA polymerase sigma-70 factor (ECF subfamily)